MKESNNKRPIREMLGYLEKRPGMYLGTGGKRLDYLCHFIDGWLLGNKEPLINYKYHMGITQWISDWILKNKSIDVSHLRLSGPKYIMIYEVTESEEEAWELFFIIAFEYIDYLELKEKIES